MNGGFPRLVADVGGTNARFALQRSAEAALSDAALLATADHPTLEDAIRSYLRQHGGAVPRWAAIGIATNVEGDDIRMTNNAWAFSTAALQAALGLERLLVVNDFTALALAVPGLAPSERVAVGGGNAQAVDGGTLALIGPGTGLGVGGLLRHQGRNLPIAGEGGHVTLAPVDDREAAVVEWLRRRFGHASAERALSGPGLENLYAACCELDRHPPSAFDAAAITAHAIAAGDPYCCEAVALFFALLGTTAGNLALTFGAFGGVYLGGGIMPRLLPLIEGSRFRARFDAKGRFGDYLRRIPTIAIVSDRAVALDGAARAFDLFG